MQKMVRQVSHEPTGPPEGRSPAVVRATWTPSVLNGLDVRPWVGEEAAEASSREERCKVGPYHAFTMDVEDWQQSVLDRSLPVSERFVQPTYRLAELLERHRASATFFFLGNTARKVPQLVRDLHHAGHEIAIHGYDHTPLHELTPDAFRDDLRRTRDIVEGVIGAPVFGYRAPRFSIDHRNPWALEVLAECGLRYDSSIFPMRIRGYGVAGWPVDPHEVRTRGGATIIEAPVACGRLLGLPLPIGGGGYFRLLPMGLVRRQIRILEALGRGAILYCHPHEFDEHGFDDVPARVPLTTRLHQGLGRAGLMKRIETLLRAFRFVSLRVLLGVLHLTANRHTPTDRLLPR